MRHILIGLLLLGAGGAMLLGMMHDKGRRKAPRDELRALRITGFVVLTTGSLAVLAWRENRLRPHDKRRTDTRGEQTPPSVWRDRPRPVRPSRRVIDLHPPSVPRRRRKSRRPRSQPRTPKPRRP